MKNNQQNAVSGRFRFHFCFPLPSHAPIPPALPPFRGRGLVAAASGSPAAGKRRGGSIPILPRGNRAKFAVNLPLPFTACGKGPRLRLAFLGADEGPRCRAGGGAHGGKVTPPAPPGSAEATGPLAVVPPRRPELSREAGMGGRGFPPRPGAAPGRCRGAPTTCGPGSRSPPRRPRRDYSSRQPAGRRAGRRPISGARRVARGLNGGRARGGAGEPPAGGRRGLRQRLSRPRVLVSPASHRHRAESRAVGKVELSGPLVCDSTPLLFIP